MNKRIPYILGALLLLALLAVIMGTNWKRPQRFDERITLKHGDKIPYGYFAAYHLLPSLFPQSTVVLEKAAPGHWNLISSKKNNQAVVIVAPYFGAYTSELDSLLSFVSNGNHVLVIARNLSNDAQRFFDLENRLSDDEGFMKEDSLTISLESPPYQSKQEFTYPGRSYSTKTSLKDSSHLLVLGRSKSGNANFIQYRINNGSISLHLSPLAFSNFFILHKNNIDFYRKAFSVFPVSISKVAWNEYYFDNMYYHKSSKDKGEPGWLSVLFRYREFKWALVTALATILLFVLLGMRRRQRMIPEHTLPTNESLDFVKTLGRLYYDRKDHRNLAKKMGVFFLEHVRSNFKIPTHTLDEAFVDVLHFKSGYGKKEIDEIVSFILFIEKAPAITDGQLYAFHRKLELFYQNT